MHRSKYVLPRTCRIKKFKWIGTKELFHFASVSTLRVYIPVPEVYTDAVRTGEKVTLTFDEYPGRTSTGTLMRTLKHFL